jgi:hypothetical protein
MQDMLQIRVEVIKDNRVRYRHRQERISGSNDAERAGVWRRKIVLERACKELVFHLMKGLSI